MNYEIVAKNIRNELHDYVVKYNLKSLVLGISGGIDSCLAAILARPVCDHLDIPLIGYSLPCETNKNDEKERAENIGSLFCDNFETVYIDESVETLKSLCNIGFEADEKTEKLAQGNIKARTRMIFLYNAAQITGGIVLSTDNATELYQGFWTLHGDVGDVAMFQNLWKTEVYGLSKYIAETEWSGVETAAIMDCVTANPTDGLGISNSDLDQLGKETYTEVDDVLINYFAGDASLVNDVVIKRYHSTMYKRNNPYNFTREVCIEGAA